MTYLQWVLPRRDRGRRQFSQPGRRARGGRHQAAGTSYTTFTLDHPGYGNAVRSAVTAGGTRSPWSARASFRATALPEWWPLCQSGQEINELAPLRRGEGSEHGLLDLLENGVEPEQCVGALGSEGDDVAAFVAGVDLPVDEAT